MNKYNPVRSIAPRTLTYSWLVVFMTASLSAEPWTWDTGSGIPYLAEKNEDGTAYQFKFLSTAGVHYYVQSSTDLNLWTNDSFYRGMGSTIVHPLFLLPQNDGSDPDEEDYVESAVTVNPSLMIRKIPDDSVHAGLLMTWVSLDDETPKNYILYGAALEDNAPLMYSRVFDEYQFFIQFFGTILDLNQIPSTDALAVKDAAMIAKLLDSLPAINAEILANTAAQASAPPSPPRTGTAKFYRLHYAYVDSDLDGLQDHLEHQQGTDMWNWDTDGDGLSDGVDPEPLVNAAVADPDGAGLAASLDHKLLARYDFEQLVGSGNEMEFQDQSGKNNHAIVHGMGVDSLGMVSKATSTTAGFANIDGETLQGKADYSLSFWTNFEKDSIKTAPVGTIRGLYGIYDYLTYVCSAPALRVIKQYNLRGLRVVRLADGTEEWKFGGHIYHNDPNGDGYSGQ